MLTNHPHISIRQLEDVLGFSRQGYYQYWQRQAGQVSYEVDILQLVRKIRQDHPRIGGRKLYGMLEKEFLERGIKMGRDGFFDLLAANRLLIRRRRRKVRTTFSGHPFRKYPNLIKELVVERPNQVWVSDITYWFTQFGCLYISFVTDAYRSGDPVQANYGIQCSPDVGCRLLQSGSTNGAQENKEANSQNIDPSFRPRYSVL